MIAIVLGSTIIAGWLVGATVLTRVLPDLPAAMPNSALMFIACGVALLLDARPEPGRAARVSAPALAALVVVLATATVVEHARAPATRRRGG